MRRALAVGIVMVCARVAAAEPELQAPWNKIDFRGSSAAAVKAVGATELEERCFDDGTHLTAGVCWRPNDARADQTLWFYFASAEAAHTQLTAAWGPPSTEDGVPQWSLRAGNRRLHAEQHTPSATGVRVELRERIDLAPYLSEGAPHGIGTVVGKTEEELATAYGKRLQCDSPTSPCKLHAPYIDGAWVNGSVIHFDNKRGAFAKKRVAVGVWMLAGCTVPCVDSKTVKTWAGVLGKPTFRTIRKKGEERIEVRFPNAPKRFSFVIPTWGRPPDDHALICLGTCG